MFTALQSVWICDGLLDNTMKTAIFCPPFLIAVFYIYASLDNFSHVKEEKTQNGNRVATF